ncbi:hypothetical protein QBC38DRAFT_54794 [Podospora fimiseda]|uniref:C2H2-type domain-containing protein n=1 Tax=Podospora fimiseda TaxID=252190 RepID=A0AAN7BH52_9PEZI|nr:hypothetical protein QBC38DRAFT_54794 [Podospora fimiseda]
MDPRDTRQPAEVTQNADSSRRTDSLRIKARPRVGTIVPVLGKGAFVETPERETPHEEIRDSWVSVTSTNDGRASLVPSIFSNRGSTLSGMTRYSIESPTSLVSPMSPEQRKDSMDDNDNIYSCTFCNASFPQKAEWHKHETEEHGKVEFLRCTGCSDLFSAQSLLVAHQRGQHGVISSRDISNPVGYTRYQSAWGCGFCSTYFPSKEDYLSDVGRHYDGGSDKSGWQFSGVIKALLHQPVLEIAWAALVRREEKDRGAKLKISWDSRAAGLSNDGDLASLRQVLEFFATGNQKADEVVQLAFRLAKKDTLVDISGLRRQVFPDGRDGDFNRPLPTRPKSSEPSRAAETTSPKPHQATEGSEPQVAPTTFASMSAKRVGLGRELASSKILARVGGSTARSSSVPASTSRGVGQSNTSSRQSGQNSASGSLRRVDSDRNLASFSQKEPLVRSMEASPLTTPSVSVDKVPNRHHNGNSVEDFPGSSRGDGLLAPNQQSPLMSVRTFNSSSTLSDHTRDASTFVEDSTSDLVSDESLSEPDSWVGAEEGSAELRAWKSSFNRTVNRGMNDIWARYNHDFEALIRQCVGGERSSHSPQFRDSSGRVRKGASSRYGANRGLRPPSRSFGDDEEDDEEDGDGYRPSSAFSKGSPGSLKKFACPFRKHDPHKYNIHDHEVCTIRSWSAISRLKEHLYRRHYKTHCQRCKQTFSDARELAEHEMTIQGCEVVEGNVPSDITSYQEKQLKSRKHNARRKTDEEKWREIYELLFPNEPVPSPYPESTGDLCLPSTEAQSSLDFQHFLLASMPQIFAQTAEEYYGRQEAVRMEAIPNLIRDSLHKAFQTWESNGNDPEVLTREASVALGSFPVETSTTPPYNHASAAMYQTPPTSARTPMDQAYEASYRNFEHMGTSDVVFPTQIQTTMEDPFTTEAFISPVTAADFQHLSSYSQYQVGENSAWDSSGLGLVNGGGTGGNVLYTEQDLRDLSMMSPFHTYHQG